MLKRFFKFGIFAIMLYVHGMPQCIKIIKRIAGNVNCIWNLDRCSGSLGLGTVNLGLRVKP